ncbi:MAG: hypothetical protein OSA47_06435 [Novosphingopyxis baekryungensis]|nr:hypothetical protein [Novosphingopyxis baekryungensis]
MWQATKDWFLSLGENYGVDPLIFGIIYVGAIPFFLLSIAWLVRNKRAGKPIVLPVLSAGVFFVSAYVYLAIVGRNIPVWVWFFLGAMIVYGVWSTVRDIRKKIALGPDA